MRIDSKLYLVVALQTEKSVFYFALFLNAGKGNLFMMKSAL